MKRHALLVLPLLLAPMASAATVGTNQAAPSLTAAMVANAPEALRADWLAYLQRSDALREADKASLAAERAKLTGPIPEPPPSLSHDPGMDLKRDASWYGEADARHIADTVVSFQTPAGGWGKNVDRRGPARQPGQSFVAEDGWSYVGTIDNEATSTEMRFLAMSAKASPGIEGDAYRASFLKGLHYLLTAQYPNGGWPQIFPLQGDYHDGVTLNDNAMVNVLQLLTDIANNRKDLYAFVPEAQRAQARDAAAHGIDCLLAAQIKTDGKLGIWAQQYEPLTLTPAPARKFEPAMPSSAESANVLLYLMSLPAPSPKVVVAINAGVRWLQATAVTNHEWTKDRRLVAKAGAGPVWARYYDAASLQPRFGDRDMSIHDDVNDLSNERRTGYAWYNTSPVRVFQRYVAWAKEHQAH